MSFQLTIQLPPGQCWKVIQQTNTKLVCALLQQLQTEWSASDSLSVDTWIGFSILSFPFTIPFTML